VLGLLEHLSLVRNAIERVLENGANLYFCGSSGVTFYGEFVGG
jgi:hypothetical protein